MDLGCVHPRRRAITAALCLMLCAVGVYSCLTHLTIYLDVEIFELNLLIEDLIILAGYVLMAVGAFRVNPVLPGLGLSVVALEKIVGLCTDLWFSEAQKTAQEICTLVFVDVFEIAGLLFAVLIILSQVRVLKSLSSFAKKCWFVPALLLMVSFVGYLFANIGVLTDATFGMLFLWLAVVSFCVWCTDPEGIPRWIARRIRENEAAENK